MSVDLITDPPEEDPKWAQRTATSARRGSVTAQQVAAIAEGLAGDAQATADAAEEAANNIGPTQILDDAIETRHVLAGAIVAGKLSAGAVTAGDIAADAITADLINAGALKVGAYLESTNYVPDVSGWRIHADGSVEFESGIFRGVVEATGGEIVGDMSVSGRLLAESETAFTRARTEMADGRVRFLSGPETRPWDELDLAGNVAATHDASFGGGAFLRVAGYEISDDELWDVTVIPGGASLTVGSDRRAQLASFSDTGFQQSTLTVGENSIGMTSTGNILVGPATFNSASNSTTLGGNVNVVGDLTRGGNPVSQSAVFLGRVDVDGSSGFVFDIPDHTRWRNIVIQMENVGNTGTGLSAYRIRFNGDTGTNYRSYATLTDTGGTVRQNLFGNDTNIGFLGGVGPFVGNGTVTVYGTGLSSTFHSWDGQGLWHGGATATTNGKWASGGRWSHSAGRIFRFNFFPRAGAGQTFTFGNMSFYGYE